MKRISKNKIYKKGTNEVIGHIRRPNPEDFDTITLPFNYNIYTVKRMFIPDNEECPYIGYEFEPAEGVLKYAIIGLRKDSVVDLETMLDYLAEA